MIKRLSEIEGEPEVGKFYVVPCVPLYVLGVRGGWWPVLTPSHRDPELNADFEHHHYDWRFVSNAHYKSVLSSEGRGDASRIFSVVASVSMFGDEDVTWRRMQCKRVPPPFPSHNAGGSPNRLVKTLEPKYHARRLGACMTCPHKGLSLKGQPVKDGKVICPGHGLAWDVKTGEMIPRV